MGALPVHHRLTEPGSTPAVILTITWLTSHPRGAQVSHLWCEKMWTRPLNNFICILSFKLSSGWFRPGDIFFLKHICSQLALLRLIKCNTRLWFHAVFDTHTAAAGGGITAAKRQSWKQFFKRRLSLNVKTVWVHCCAEREGKGYPGPVREGGRAWNWQRDEQQHFVLCVNELYASDSVYFANIVLQWLVLV